jgi:hypothetical protein
MDVCASASRVPAYPTITCHDGSRKIEIVPSDAALSANDVIIRERAPNNDGMAGIYIERAANSLAPASSGSRQAREAERIVATSAAFSSNRSISGQPAIRESENAEIADGRQNRSAHGVGADGAALADAAIGAGAPDRQTVSDCHSRDHDGTAADDKNAIGRVAAHSKLRWARALDEGPFVNDDW